MTYNIDEMQIKLMKSLAFSEYQDVKKQLNNFINYYVEEGAIESFSSGPMLEGNDSYSGYIQNIEIKVKGSAPKFGLRICIPYNNLREYIRAIECIEEPADDFLTKAEVNYPWGYGTLSLEKTESGYRRETEIALYLSSKIKIALSEGAEQRFPIAKPFAKPPRMS